MYPDLVQEKLTARAEFLGCDKQPEIQCVHEDTLQFGQLRIGHDGKELAHAPEQHGLVLPHLVREQEGRDKQRPPSAGAENDLRALPKITEVDDAYDQLGNAESALVKNPEHELAHLVGGADMH